MKSALQEARTGLKLRRRRSLLTAVGILLAAAMLAAAIVVGDSLGRGFDRAAKQANLADIIVRFDPQEGSKVAQRIVALPDVKYFSLRQEVTDEEISAGANSAGNASLEIVGAGGSGPHGYAVVAGHDITGAQNGVVVERGLAAQWHVPLNGTIDLQGLGPERVVGFAEEPDNVSYPLAAPQVYISQRALAASLGGPPGSQVNEAQIWLRDPRYLNEVLVQARATSYGLRGLQFVTRSGVRVLLDQAAGIVIDLLVALSLIALATAGVLLASSARAEVERRLKSIGVRRAVGAPRGHISLTQTLEALLIAVPAATLGTVGGVLATTGPSDRLLMLLNEPSAGAALIAPLAAGWAISLAIPASAAAWPAWRAAGRSPIELLRGGELRSGQASRQPRVKVRTTGLTALGARLAAARRTRLAATAVTLGCSTAFVLLMLALASALSVLQTDPQALGKRYQLTANLPASAAPRVSRIAGVQAAGPRYEDQAADSFSLGETVDVIGYGGHHARFEAPPLTAGRRIAGPHEAEAGAGLADALGLSPGSTLALEFSSGSELRLTVSGVVSSLEHDGRVAYVPAQAMLRADPSASEQLVVVAKPGANIGAIENTLNAEAPEAAAAPASTAVGKGVPLVNTLRAILIAVAVVDGLVCLYALAQACALTVQERRRTVAIIRASGAGAHAVRRLLAGAAAALVIPAAALGIAVEVIVLGPALSNLAANYATLPLTPTIGDLFAVLIGLGVAAAAAVLWVARQATTESIVQGLAAT